MAASASYYWQNGGSFWATRRVLKFMAQHFLFLCPSLSSHRRLNWLLHMDHMGFPFWGILVFYIDFSHDVSQIGHASPSTSRPLFISASVPVLNSVAFGGSWDFFFPENHGQKISKPASKVTTRGWPLKCLPKVPRKQWMRCVAKKSHRISVWVLLWESSARAVLISLWKDTTNRWSKQFVWFTVSIPNWCLFSHHSRQWPAASSGVLCETTNLGSIKGIIAGLSDRN